MQLLPWDQASLIIDTEDKNNVHGLHLRAKPRWPTGASHEAAVPSPSEAHGGGWEDLGEEGGGTAALTDYIPYHKL